MAAAGGAAAAASTEFEVPDLSFSCLVFDVDFHPKQDVVAIGLVNGRLEIFRYEPGACKKAVSLPLYTDSLRSLRFNQEGTMLLTGSSNKALKCLDIGGKVVWQNETTHTAPVNVVRPIAAHLAASGDDDGNLCIWDLRTSAGPVCKFDAQKDVITDIYIDEGRATMLASSGDGSLACYDLNKGVLQQRSEPLDDELLSIAVIKDGSTVVTGTQGGMLQIWKWGKWTWREDEEEDGPERFKGHPQSIDGLLKVDEDTLVTGSSDGLLRLITIRPNKLVGILGEHDEFPVERLAWSRDKRLIGSASHDNKVKFWDVGYLFEEDDDEEGDEEEDGLMSAAFPASAAAGAGGAGAAGKKGGKGRFVDLPALGLPVGEDSDEDLEDESDFDEDTDDLDSEEDDEDDDEDSDGGMKEETAAAAGGAGKKSAAGGKKPAGKAAGGAGKPAKKKGGAAAAAADLELEDDDEDDDSEEDSRKGKKGKQKGGKKGGKPAMLGKKKGGGAGGGGGFFSDL